jgi:uncharacterized protein
MRRDEREIKDRAAIDAVIRRSQVCRLGLADGREPYVVPLCFGYDGRALYLHAAREGRKLEILRRNDRVCFEFDIFEGIVEAEAACHWGVRYQSVIGTGTARMIEDLQGKREALALIMAQYSTRTFAFPGEMVEKTAVVEVEIETLTGKQTARS